MKHFGAPTKKAIDDFIVVYNPVPIMLQEATHIFDEFIVLKNGLSGYDPNFCDNVIGPKGRSTRVLVTFVRRDVTVFKVDIRIDNEIFFFD